MNCAILGVSGYTGQALYECLSNHPFFKLTKYLSATRKLSHLDQINPLWPKLPIESFDPNHSYQDLDFIFLAIPHGESHQFMATLLKNNSHLKVIDLSADFRLGSVQQYQDIYGFQHQSPDLLDKAVYGAPEINKTALKDAVLCANPGCYAIASILALLPIQHIAKDQSVIIDAKSGVSGAGKALKENFLFCEVNESFSAYKTGKHRHQAEIAEKVSCPDIFFSPHLIPQQRGILASIYVSAPESMTESTLVELYESYYAGSIFVKIHQTDQPSTKWVVGNNYCLITPKCVGNKIVVFSAIDNLLKGAASLAVQNANIMADFPEDAGLNS